MAGNLNTYLRKSGNLKLLLSLYILILLFPLLLISSCSEEEIPVNPPQNNPLIYDSSYFEWDYDTIHVSPQINFFIADTNKIFIPQGIYLAYLNNGVTTYINIGDPDFRGFCANGTDINNVYIGGVNSIHLSSSLKRWDGVFIKDIAMPVDTATFIRSIEIISPNEIWLSTNENIIYHYLNNNFVSYRFDENLKAGYVYKDNSGNLYSRFYDPIPGDYDYLYMYKFENNKWELVCKDSANRQTGIGYVIGFSDKKMLRSGIDGIYCFNGFGWSKYIHLGNIIKPHIAAGENERNILIHAEYINDDYRFYFDGNHIYRLPNKDMPYVAINTMQFKYNRFYTSTHIFGRKYDSYIGKTILRGKEIIKLK